MDVGMQMIFARAGYGDEVTDGQVYDVTQRVSPPYTWQDIPDGSLGWTVDDPAQGVWTMYVNADGFYIWYDIDFTVSITADFYTCRGEIATVVLGTGSATAAAPTIRMRPHFRACIPGTTR